MARHAAHQVLRGIAAEQHVDMARGRDGGAVGRDHVLAAVGVLEVPGEDRQPLGDLVDLEDVLVVIGLEMARDLGGADQLRVVAAEAGAEGMQRAVGRDMADAAHDHGRVDAGAGGDADPLVRRELAANDLDEGVAEIAHMLGVRALRHRDLRLPEALGPQLAALDRHPLPRRHVQHASDAGLVAIHATLAVGVADHQRVDPAGDVRHRQKRLQLAGEDPSLPRLDEQERAHAEEVDGQHQPVGSLVPDRHGKAAAQLRQRIQAVPAVELAHQPSVARRRVRAPEHQLLAILDHTVQGHSRGRWGRRLHDGSDGRCRNGPPRLAARSRTRRRDAPCGAPLPPSHLGAQPRECRKSPSCPHAPRGTQVLATRRPSAPVRDQHDGLIAVRCPIVPRKRPRHLDRRRTPTCRGAKAWQQPRRSEHRGMRVSRAVARRASTPQYRWHAATWRRPCHGGISATELHARASPRRRRCRVLRQWYTGQSNRRVRARPARLGSRRRQLGQPRAVRDAHHRA